MNAADPNDPRCEICLLEPSLPESSQGAAIDEPQQVHRKIAKLPKPLRQLVNSMLDDGCSARRIIAKLEASTDPPLPYPISMMSISDWRNTGYRRHLAQQERLALF